MPVSVSMHACSTWPVSIDFVVFRFFLAGYSVEEAVEQLMALQSVPPPSTAARQRTASASSSTSAALSDAASDSGISAVSTTSPSVSRSTARRAQARRQGSRRPLPPAPPPQALPTPQDTAQLTEDVRVDAAEEAPEELTVASSLPTVPATLPRAGSVPRPHSGAHTPTTVAAYAATVTTMTTSAADISLTSISASRSGAPSPAVADAAAGKSAADHRTRHRSHHHHRSHTHHHSQAHTQQADRDKARSGTGACKKAHHSTAQSSRQRTAANSSTTTTRTSFALPSTLNNGSAGNNDSVPFAAGLSSFRRSTDDATAAALTAAAGAANGSGLRAAGAAGAYHGHHQQHRASSGEAKVSSSSQQRRERRRRDRAERQCFFLNEGYIKFQRQLQEVEAIGGAGIGASSLQSRYLFEEVSEQYQAFRELAREEQLGSPYAFLSNFYLPIPVATRLQLLQMYYQTDPGVFRWAFGDKLSRFDLPAALSAVQEEYANGTLPAGAARHGGGAAGDGSGGPVGGGSGPAGGGGFFWTSRWKSSPGKLATMDAATVLRLGDQYVDALRRQWENVKHVCVTVAALYRGKGGLCVPLDMPLLTTIQQCFGLRQEQALDYATAAFGYEHRLETRMFAHLHHFSEYGAICSIAASLWCDRSGYFLCESFREGCRRLARLLDEYRVLSELHQLVFGEAMRPRWQVQLDEVQRVITTSSLVEKNTMASAAVPGTGPVPAAGVGGGVAGGATASASGTPTAGAGPSALHAALSTPPPPGAMGSSGGGGGCGHGAAHAGHGLAADAAGTSAAAAGASSMHSPLSGNGQYSRRFLMEFPSLMKHLLRVCVALGGNGGVNDALDIFFNRIYAYLEVLSSRSAPAIVSLVVNAAAPALGAATPQAGAGGLASGGSSSCGGAVGPLSAAASVPTSGRPPLLPPYGERVRSDGDLSRAPTDNGCTMAPTPGSLVGAQGPGQQSGLSGCSASSRTNTSLSRPLRAGLTRSPSANALFRSSGTRASIGGGGPEGTSLSALASAADLRASVEDGVPVGTSSSFPYAASTVVNTSLFHPASVLLPLTAAMAAQGGSVAGSFVSSPLLPTVASRGFASEEEPTGPEADGSAAHLEPQPPRAASATTAAAAAAGAGVGGRFPGVSSLTSPSGGAGVGSGFATALQSGAATLLPSQVSDMVLKVIDKRYLRELCTLLTALPRGWRQLTALTPEDHAATDKAVSDLVMALKAITQVLMASDDFQ